MLRKISIIFCLFAAWAVLLYTRIDAHWHIMTGTWVVWLVVSHAISLGIGWVLHGVTRENKVESTHD